METDNIIAIAKEKVKVLKNVAEIEYIHLNIDKNNKITLTYTINSDNILVKNFEKITNNINEINAALNQKVAISITTNENEEIDFEEEEKDLSNEVLIYSKHQKIKVKTQEKEQ